MNASETIAGNCEFLALTFNARPALFTHPFLPRLVGSRSKGKKDTWNTSNPYWKRGARGEWVSQVEWKNRPHVALKWQPNEEERQHMFTGFLYILPLSWARTELLYPVCKRRDERGSKRRKMRNSWESCKWGDKRQNRGLLEQQHSLKRQSHLNLLLKLSTSLPKVVWPRDSFECFALQPGRRRIMCGSRANYNLRFALLRQARSYSRIHQLSITISVLQLPQLGILIRYDKHVSCPFRAAVMYCFGVCARLRARVRVRVSAHMLQSTSPALGKHQTMRRSSISIRGQLYSSTPAAHYSPPSIYESQQ